MSARDAARESGVCGIEGNEAGLQGMIDVRLADEIAGDGLEVVIELRAPAARAPVDEMAR